jgi:hypothetical protein
MLVSNAKLIATALFEHCDGFFGTAMKAKGIVVKGSRFFQPHDDGLRHRHGCRIRRAHWEATVIGTP